jgi:hypothetical protein
MNEAAEFRPELPNGAEIEDIALSQDGKLLAVGIESGDAPGTAERETSP